MGRPIFTPSRVPLVDEGLSRTARRERGLGAYPILRIALMFPPAEAGLRSEGMDVAERIVDRHPEAAKVRDVPGRNA